MNLPTFVALAVAALGWMPGCTAVRTMVHNYADLDDHRIFANRTVARSDTPSPLRRLIRAPRFIREMQVPDGTGGTRTLERYLEETRTAAFVVMRNDRIVYERYARGHDERSLLNSFSIAKPIVATLVGIALSEGAIASLDATVADYRPEFAGTPYGAIRLRNLLTMTSGLGDAPTLLPHGAEHYYGDDLRAITAKAVQEAEQGSRWRYSDTDVQVLGFVLEAAVGRPVSAYLSEKLWKPLGMESDALWALDREGGAEKTFCCVSARARDFARLGRLYLNAGRWNGNQVVPLEWAARHVLPGAAVLNGYVQRHLWWSPANEEGDFFAYGHNGQYLYINPKAHTVIVKFSETNRQDPVPMFRALAESLMSPERIAELDRLEFQAFAQDETVWTPKP
ncbi:MAG TPA: serine hydrolase [Burkholderiaceae bacterium]|nr:serine hydrolase [Burkholderiaceae bacterium]